MHALLAARLDALDATARSLVGDASVLGTSFPADALVAVSRLSSQDVQRILDDLVRRGLMEVSADVLSPQLGAYRFTHGMLRQVAYDTLARRSRKTRHLAVAEHLRNTFPNDGDEVVDVIAQHYLDAIRAVPEDEDASDLSIPAVAALTRAGARALRTGAPAAAELNYAGAAELIEATGSKGASLQAADMWERAALAARQNANSDRAIANAQRAAEHYRRHGQDRAVARTHAIIGQALATPAASPRRTNPWRAPWSRFETDPTPTPSPRCPRSLRWRPSAAGKMPIS